MKLFSPTFTLLLTLTACASAHKAPAATAVPQPAVGGAQPAADLTTAPQMREKAASILVAIASVQTTDTTEPAKNALRANAIEGLLPMPGRLEPILRNAFADKSIGIRSVAAMAMGKAKIRALVDNVQPLTNDPSPLVKGAAAFALQRNGAPADLNVLAAMLVSDSSQQRALAAFILGELGNKSAIPMLMSAAAAPSAKGAGARDKLMRLQIAEALAKLGKNEALDEIRAALYPSQADDIEATALAIQIIGQVRDTDSRPQLHNIIADGYRSNNPMPIEVRLTAAASLARLGAPGGAAFAEQYAADASAPIRAQVAAVFGETRDAKYLLRLASLMGDTDEQVRISAAAATLKITDGRR